MVTIVGPAHAAWIASAWCDHSVSMPLARSASATFGWSSSGIGASRPGRGWTELCVTRRSSVRPACSSSSHGSMSLITAISCQPSRVLRAAYLDMDGTLLGRGASLFHDADGRFTMLGARALEACARAEVEVVPYSGRRQSTLLHDARLIGAALVHLRGRLWAGARRREFERVARGDVDDRGRRQRCCSSATPGGSRCSTRGTAGASRHGCTSAGHLRRGGRRPARRARVRAPPAGRQRGDARRRRGWVARTTWCLGRPRRHGRSRAHMQMRGFAPEEVIAVGDSLEDLGAASVSARSGSWPTRCPRSTTPPAG